jgi:K+-transporting ATPase ATPase C chain
VAAAKYQAARIARVRGLPVARIEQLIDDHAEAPLFDVLGEPRVNVLQFNLALDAIHP